MGAKCSSGPVIQLFANHGSPCLPSETGLFVDGFFVDCVPSDDRQAQYLLPFVDAVCNVRLTPKWMSSNPAQRVSCGTHQLNFTQGSNSGCLSAEIGIGVDGVLLGCWTNDDTSLFPVTKPIRTTCSTGALVWIQGTTKPSIHVN